MKHPQKAIKRMMLSSGQELSEVLEEEVYVIGGIVDRSVKKRQSLQQAQEQGARDAAAAAEEPRAQGLLPGAQRGLRGAWAVGGWPL